METPKREVDRLGKEKRFSVVVLIYPDEEPKAPICGYFNYHSKKWYSSQDVEITCGTFNWIYVDWEKLFKDNIDG